MNSELYKYKEFNIKNIKIELIEFKFRVYIY